MCERAQEEIEAVEAILLDDVVVTYDEKGFPQQVRTVVFPSTAHDTNKQYVRVTLEVNLPPNYPDFEPTVRLRNPRGLDDQMLENIDKALKEKCREYLGQPVIFELIELVRENLTESNLPTCQCAVCLYGFCEGDCFIKTECYHYFHSYCLALHLTTTERLFKEEQEKLPMWQRQKNGFQAQCPVCREPINCDVKELQEAAPPKELENAQSFQLTSELRNIQAQMRELYVYQKNRGGIIDVNAEENKLLLITNSGDGTFQPNDDDRDFAGPSFAQNPNNSNTKEGPINHETNHRRTRSDRPR